MEPNHTGTTAKKLHFPSLFSLHTELISVRIRITLMGSGSAHLADPDETFQFDADPDPTFHYDADPDLAHHESGANLQPQAYGYRPSTAPFEPSRLHCEPRRLHFEPCVAPEF